MIFLHDNIHACGKGTIKDNELLYFCDVKYVKITLPFGILDMYSHVKLEEHLIGIK